ncbi:hypothetical protein M514_07223 [Trichuris suis]|uniref:Peptidase A2 domain-containing protein n=1 Tax=Trichuris suis TaxID=68888 RepID=A0A085NC46_9BILA|nr:hypothetical protein M514_07223 [Trichuris suis]
MPDKSWFPSETLSSQRATVQAPNPWLQKLVPAASIEIFDSDPKSWTRFIAGFKSMVHDALSSDVDRLAILTQLLSPRLRDGFAGLLTTPTVYRRVLQELLQLYGDPEATILQATALMDIEPLQLGTLAELECFYLQVKGPVCIFEMNGKHNELDSIVLVGQISSKLTRRLQEKWANHVHSQSADARGPRHFAEWLKNQVVEKRLLATFVSNEQKVLSSTSVRKNTGRYMLVCDPKLIRTFAVAPVSQCIVCKVQGHNVALCPAFSKMNVTERLAVIREGQLCVSMPERRSHKMRRSKKKCSIHGCEGGLHAMLYGAPRMYPSREHPPSLSSPTDKAPDSATVTTARLNWQSSNVHILCAVVPTVGTFGENTCHAFAMLDSGAEVSMMSEKLA